MSNNVRIANILASYFDDEDRRLTDLYNSRWVDHAAGAALDAIGAMVSVGRTTNEPDVEYRARVKASVAQIRSHATLENVLSFVANVAGVDVEDLMVTENQDLVTGAFRKAYYYLSVPTENLVLQGLTTDTQIDNFIATIEGLLSHVDAGGVLGVITTGSTMFYEGDAADFGPTGQGTAANGYWATDGSGDFGSNNQGGYWGGNSA